MKKLSMSERANPLNHSNVPIRPKKRTWGNPSVTTLRREQVIHLKSLEKKFSSFDEAFVKSKIPKIFNDLKPNTIIPF
jgi:hypothetical protein